MKAVAKRLAVSVVLCAGLALATSTAFAQKTANPNPYDPLVRQLNRAQTKLGPQMKYLSGGMINAFGIAKHWEGLKAGLSQAANAAALGPQAGVKPTAGTPVTTTSLASRVLGFTQSEISTAWCGTNAVVGFNDTGSVVETIGGTLAGNGLSSVGYGQSTNANASKPVFADKGFLPAPTGTAGLGGWLIGGPSGCVHEREQVLHVECWVYLRVFRTWRRTLLRDDRLDGQRFHFGRWRSDVLRLR